MLPRVPCRRQQRSRRKPPVNSVAATQPLIYTVRATFTSQLVADEWVAWLMGGHADALVRGGAERWEVFALDGAGCVREIRYRFPDRAAFERYEREFAPPLRAEGAKLFPPERGVTYERSTCEVLAGSHG